MISAVGSVAKTVLPGRLDRRFGRHCPMLSHGLATDDALAGIENASNGVEGQKYL